MMRAIQFARPTMRAGRGGSSLLRSAPPCLSRAISALATILSTTSINGNVAPLASSTARRSATTDVSAAPASPSAPDAGGGSQPNAPPTWLDEAGMTPHRNLAVEERMLLPHRPTVYQLPYFGHPDRHKLLAKLSLEQQYQLLAVYGCDFYSMKVLGLRRLMGASRPNLSSMFVGVVTNVSQRKTVGVVMRAQRYSEKYNYIYYRKIKRRAHDEFNLCRLGDVVHIQPGNQLTYTKRFLVVRNFGSKDLPEGAERADIMKRAIYAVKYDEGTAKYVPLAHPFKRLRTLRMRRAYRHFNKNKNPKRRANTRNLLANR